MFLSLFDLQSLVLKRDSIKTSAKVSKSGIFIYGLTRFCFCAKRPPLDITHPQSSPCF